MYNNLGVQAYREADINSMSKEKMIVLLYEKIISDLERARVAIDRGDRLEMTIRVNHSQRIVSELRNALDHSIGGEVSRNLESLYDFLFSQHLELLVNQDPVVITNCINVITPLLDAWKEIPDGTGDKAERDKVQGRLQPSSGPNPATENAESPQARTEKKGPKTQTPATPTPILSVSA